MSRKAAAILIACICAFACIALAACSAPAQSRSTESISAEATDVAKKELPSTDPFYVLVVGNDSRTGTVEITKGMYADGSARSDTTMLVRVDPENYVIDLITIPRDTSIDLNGQETKFNEAYHQGGIQATLEQVELLTGVKPKYYLDTTFVGFEKFIDAFGGVDVWVPMDMDLQDIVGGEHIYLSEGEQTLNGPEALVFARVRKAIGYVYDDAPEEAYRQVDDRSIVESAIRAVATGKVPADVAIKALLPNCDSNFSADDLESYANAFAENADKLTIYSATGPYNGDVIESGEWLAYRDEDAWREIIALADANQDPNTVYPHPEF